MSDSTRLPISVDALMRELGDSMRAKQRTRLMQRGGSSDYADPAVYEDVESLFRRALEERDPESLMLSGVLGDHRDWDLSTSLQWASHRPVTGAPILFIKRHILLPLTRWLYQFSRENFVRQRRVNSLLFACIEELAIENARLKQAITNSGRVE